MRRYRPAVEALDRRELLSAMPRPDHVVVVMEENHTDGQIFGSADAPYLNSLANQGAKFTQSFAITHPSQPNYLDLFSGSNQSVTTDTPPSSSFTSANLGAEVLGAGLSFVGYSEGLPSVGSTVTSSGNYVRKHNAWVDWQGSGTNQIPASANQPFSSFPSDYSQLPTVSFVVPDLTHDMHNGTSKSASAQAGDAWLQQNLDGYVQWAKSHNSVLVVTFDEDDSTSDNHIATVMVGQPVQPGTYSEHIDHYDVLRTIEDMYGLGHAGASASSTAIADAWVATTTPPPPPPPPPPSGMIMVDDGGTGYTDTGWKVGGLAGGYSGDYRSAAPGTGSNVASWTFTGIGPGSYQIYATWVPYSNRPIDAPFSFKSGDPNGSTPYNTAYVNQQFAPAGMTIDGQAFSPLGTIAVPSNGYIKVKLTDVPDGYVIADAVAIMPVSAPAVQVSSAVPVPLSVPLLVEVPPAPSDLKSRTRPRGS